MHFQIKSLVNSVYKFEARDRISDDKCMPIYSVASRTNNIIIVLLSSEISELLNKYTHAKLNIIHKFY